MYSSDILVNRLARRLGSADMYPDWFIVRRLLRARIKQLVLKQKRRPIVRTLTEPGRVLTGTLIGLPELRMFPDAIARQQALENYGDGMCHDRNWRWWVFVTVLLTVSAGTGYIFGGLAAATDVPVLAYGIGNYLLRCLTMAASFGLLLRKAHLVGAAAHMRLLLIEQGVPICLKCGYCLVGHDDRAERCPECGRMINEATKAKMCGSHCPAPDLGGDGADCQ